MEQAGGYDDTEVKILVEVIGTITEWRIKRAVVKVMSKCVHRYAMLNLKIDG